MALSESYLAPSGQKIILRCSNAGEWSVKCLNPPEPGDNLWDVQWDVKTEILNGVPVPLDEEAARREYERWRS